MQQVRMRGAVLGAAVIVVGFVAAYSAYSARHALNLWQEPSSAPRALAESSPGAARDTGSVCSSDSSQDPCSPLRPPVAAIPSPPAVPGVNAPTPAPPESLELPPAGEVLTVQIVAEQAPQPAAMIRD